MIGDEREREVILFFEGFLCINRISAHANYRYALFLKILISVAQTAALSGASGSIGFGEEVHQRVALFVDVGKGEFVACFSRGGDLRSFVTYGERIGAEKGKEGNNDKKGKEAANFHTVSKKS